MDQTCLKDVHPAFAGLVRALSADEARILQSLAHKPIRQVTASKLACKTCLSLQYLRLSMSQMD
jgi:hypothetical protein